MELLRAFYLRGNPNGAASALRAATALLVLVSLDGDFFSTACAAPKPHRTLQLDLDVSTLGAPGAAQGGKGEGVHEASAAAGART